MTRSRSQRLELDRCTHSLCIVIEPALRNVCRTTLGRSRVPEYIPRTEMPLIRVVRDPLTHMPVLEVAPEPDAIYRPDYVATGVAAALTGFTFATITRSPRYAFGASVVFSALALSGHSVYTVFRRWQRRNIIAVNKNVAVIQAARDGVITADEQEHMLSATPLLHRWRDSVSSRWPDWLPLRPLTTSEYAKIKSEESLSVDQQLMKEIVAERAAAKQQQQQSPTRPTSSS